YINPSLPDEPVDGCVFSNRADNNRICTEMGFGISNPRAAASDTSDVCLEIPRRARHTPIIVGVHVNAGEGSSLRNGKAATPRNGFHVPCLGKGEAMLREGGKQTAKRTGLPSLLARWRHLGGLTARRSLVDRKPIAAAIENSDASRPSSARREEYRR